MADDTKGFNHVRLVVAGLVSLVVVWSLAIWHFPKRESTTVAPTKRLSERPFHRWLVVAGLVYIVLIVGLAIWDFSNISDFSNIWNFSKLQCENDNNKCFPHGGLILSLLASSIIIVFLLVNYKWPEPENHGANATFLIVTALLFALLFSFPQLEIDDFAVEPSDNEPVASCIQKGDKTNSESNKSDLGTTKNLIEWEHKKAVDEITERTKMDDMWYNNKFILVGGLFGAFLAYSATFVGKARNEEGILANNLTNHIADMFKTSLPASVLGMACVVSIGIDLHMRSSAIVTHQLGLWIAHCVEGILNIHPNIFTGWENFLRIDKNDSRGMHRDFMFGIFAAAHFYFSSVYLYVVYLSCVFFYFSPVLESGFEGQNLGASQEKKEQKLRSQFRFILFVFSLVHVTLLLFVIGGNFIPSILKIEFALWPTRPFSGPTAVVLPLALCFLVSGLAFIRLFTLYKSQLHKAKLRQSVPSTT